MLKTWQRQTVCEYGVGIRGSALESPIPGLGPQPSIHTSSEYLCTSYITSLSHSFLKDGNNAFHSGLAWGVNDITYVKYT